jgi:mono/diheme cytochrome c family protein
MEVHMFKRNWIMLLAILFLVGLISGCNVNPQPAGLTPIPPISPATTATLLPELPGTSGGGTSEPGTGNAPSGSAAIGVADYMRNCTPCHGDQGQGAIGPALRNSSFIQSNDQGVVQTISNGRPGTAMPAWLMANGGPLTSNVISNIAAYLKSIQNSPQIPRSTEQPVEPTETAAPANAPTPEPARPSNTGNPGAGATLAGDAKRGMPAFGQVCAACHGPQGVQGIPNPGSEDGFVPPLNPIDPTLKNSDPKAFALNIDLFLEHGSVPDGDGPMVAMPGFGDSKSLPDQTIADIIAYVISLNSQ